MVAVFLHFSSGGASVHFHLLSAESQMFFTRAIVMSGSALAYFAISQERNHQSIVYDAFAKQLNYSRDPKDMLQFLKRAGLTELFQLSSIGISFLNGLAKIQFAPVIESNKKYSFSSNSFI